MKTANTSPKTVSHWCNNDGSVVLLVVCDIGLMIRHCSGHDLPRRVSHQKTMVQAQARWVAVYNGAIIQKLVASLHNKLSIQDITALINCIRTGILGNTQKGGGGGSFEYTKVAIELRISGFTCRSSPVRIYYRLI